jgi:aminopeptidase N
LIYFLFNLIIFEFSSDVPAFIVSDETLAKAQKWLDVTGKDAPNALRRVITEGRDALARSLGAQKKDA